MTKKSKPETKKQNPQLDHFFHSKLLTQSKKYSTVTPRCGLHLKANKNNIVTFLNCSQRYFYEISAR